MTIVINEQTRQGVVTGSSQSSAELGGGGRSEEVMSLTYSDFLYSRNEYSDSEMYYEDGEVPERRRLPSEFKPIQETKVPLLQENDDPANYDFIIIAEFSELEGPVPLCTIPNTATETTDINLNDFVVHLMSTDYQVNSVGRFRICQDTQVVRKNVFANVHVFMQYFTLYDLKARGFVRPFCFGYVTKDHIKLDKYMNFLVSEFGKVTSVLKYCNREWFSHELRLYLEKLQLAKDSYIQKYKDEGNETGLVSSNEDEFLDSDAITLDQIAHQYSEMQNILEVVQNFKNPNLTYAENIISDMNSFIKDNSETKLSSFLREIDVRIGSYNDLSATEFAAASESLNIPLVHPLRLKGQPLRPLTVMGQMGSVYLVAKLMQLCTGSKMDIIFTEMTEKTLSFRQHFRNIKLTTEAHDQNLSGSTSQSTDLDSSDSIAVAVEATEQSDISSDDIFSGNTNRFHKQSISEVSPFEIVKENSGINHIHSLLPNLNKNELQQIIEKLHSPTPVITDNGSGSYHTVSEEDSDPNIPSLLAEASADIHVQPSPSQKSNSSATSTGGKNRSATSGGEAVKMSSLTSFSSDEDMSLTNSPVRGSVSENSEEIVLKEPWWVYAAQKLIRGAPGYGLANFFRRYHSIAHHVVYSILLGRPIIICGEERMSKRIGRIITSLIPLVPLLGGPGFSNSSGKGSCSFDKKSWKLLRWHRGIIVQSHIEAYRLIGLCIPEKLEVYDLIPPRLVTLITIISAEKKCILGGPAYSGDIFQNFEKRMQEHFYNSDVSLLSYIGSLYTEIEAKVYMYKALSEKYKKGDRSKVGTGSGSPVAGISLLFKELNLRASDAEIVKYLSGLINDPSECVNIL